MPWWGFVIIGNFLLAVAAVLDKFLVSGPIADPRRYAMLSALVSIFALFLLVPGLLGYGGDAFQWQQPGALAVALGIAHGSIGVAALFFLFTAFVRDEASRAAPTVGAFNVVFTVVLAAAFLSERVSLQQGAGIALLLLGSALLTFRKGWLSSLPHYLTPALFSGFLFALSLMLLKALFGLVPFVTALVIAGITQFAVGVFLLLTSPKKAKAHNIRLQIAMPRPIFALFAAKQVLAAVGSLLIVFAISLANVSLVNATEGVKYAFLFVMVVAASLWMPRLLREDLSGSPLAAKLSGMVSTGVGFALVAIKIF